ncbi:MAG: hypothetical protein AAF327_23625 [Cyanobacteria bacterium P01_A01_bin.37]
MINTDKLVHFLHSSSAEVLDAMLDTRDSPSFESAWNEIYDRLKPIDTSPDTESIFIAISNATCQHEIASYVADDIDLIYAADKSGFTNAFINWLKSEYIQGHFPYSRPDV